MLGGRSTGHATEAPRGFTLIEVTIALVLGALVLGLVFAVGSRLTRQLNAETTRLAVSDQLESAAEILPIDLRGVSPVGGDIAFGEARDTSLQLRQTIANALVCGGSASSWLVAPYLATGGRSIAPGIQDGDTAWLLADTDPGERWRAIRLVAVHRTSGSCPVVGDANGARVFDVTHLWSIDLRDTGTANAGMVIRVTRPIRFSFYRASDGQWYLGLRSWNSVSLQFNGVQPISGPFAAPSRGTGFVYFDSTGTRVSPGVADTRAIARIEAVFRADSTDAASARVSVVVVAALRNR